MPLILIGLAWFYLGVLWWTVLVVGGAVISRRRPPGRRRRALAAYGAGIAAVVVLLWPIPLLRTFVSIPIVFVVALPFLMLWSALT